MRPIEGWLGYLSSVVLAVCAAAGCETAAATQLPVPRERATECRQHCASLDMELGALVIMMNHAGCVCQPRPAPPPAVPPAPSGPPTGAPTPPPPPQASAPIQGAATIAGAGVIAMIAEEQRQEERRQDDDRRRRQETQQKH